MGTWIPVKITYYYTEWKNKTKASSLRVETTWSIVGDQSGNRQFHIHLNRSNTTRETNRRSQSHRNCRSHRCRQSHPRSP